MTGSPRGWTGCPRATGRAVLTAVGIALWAPFASVVQVLVYRRGLRPGRTDRRRREGRSPARARSAPPAPATRSPGGRDRRLRRLGAADRPRPAGPAPGVIAWLALAWLVARPERDFVPSALLAGLLASRRWSRGHRSLPLETTLARRSRALLVAVATWFRAAAGTPGIREVSQRVLGRLAACYPGREAGRCSATWAPPTSCSRRPGVGGRAERRPQAPAPVLDAVLRWVADESRRFRPAPQAPPPALAFGHATWCWCARRGAVALPVTGGRAPERRRWFQRRSTQPARAQSAPTAVHAGEDEASAAAPRSRRESPRVAGRTTRRGERARAARAAPQIARRRPAPSRAGRHALRRTRRRVGLRWRRRGWRAAPRATRLEVTPARFPRRAAGDPQAGRWRARARSRPIVFSAAGGAAFDRRPVAAVALDAIDRVIDPGDGPDRAGPTPLDGWPR